MPLVIGTTGTDLPGTIPRIGRAFSTSSDPTPIAPASSTTRPASWRPTRDASLIAIDLTMHEPARFLARHMTAPGQPAWIYRFDYVADSLRSQMPSAPHASEVAYLFDQLGARYGEAVTRRDRALAKTFHEYFVNFAKHGDPNGGGHGDGHGDGATQRPAWSKFDPARFDLMMFTGDGEGAMQADPWQERLRLVERALERRENESR